MSVSAKIQENSSYTQVTFTTRINTAIDMLFYADQLDTQQETEGAWDGFQSQLRDSLSLLDVRADFRVQYFKGVSDVIFELTVIIQPDSSFNLEVNDERIAGTIFTSLCNHFNWTGWGGTPVLEDSYDANKYKHLAAFKR